MAPARGADSARSVPGRDRDRGRERDSARSVPGRDRDRGRERDYARSVPGRDRDRGRERDSARSVLRCRDVIRDAPVRCGRGSMSPCRGP